MKLRVAIFVILSTGTMVTPVLAECLQDQGAAVDQSSAAKQNTQPCRANEPIILAQNTGDSGTNAPTPRQHAFQQQRLAQPDGLGFGLSIAELPGINFFYDHTLDLRSQFHVEIGSNLGRSENIFGTSSIEVTQVSALATYRRFFSPNRGFYYGAGLGIAKNELKYSDSGIFGDQSASYNASGRGVFALAEIGWQGSQGYYFHVGLRPGAYLSYNDNYDVNNIPDTANHRHVANNDWDKSKAVSRLELGFGWFF